MSSAVPFTLADFADSVNVAIQSIHSKMTNLEAENYSKYFTVQSTEDYYEKDSSLSGFGEAARLTEGAIITSESPVQGFDQTYTQVFHGKMAQFTMYDWKFGIKKRRLESTVQDLDGACRRKRERLTTEYLEKSIANGSSYSVADDSGNYTKSLLGGDGQELIDSAHTREDGGSSWSNVVTDGVTDNMDFALDALKAAHRTASLIRDPKGNLMNINLDTLVVRKGSANYFKAMEINGALKAGVKPESTDRDGAAFGAFDIIALPYLTTTVDAYFWMFDSSMKNAEMGLQYRGSQEVILDSPEVDYKTKTILVSSTIAFDYGHNDGRSWVGSEGDNAT